MAIRVVDYIVVSTSKQVETTTVHKRVVVTFNGTADVPISLGDYSCVLHLDPQGGWLQVARVRRAVLVIKGKIGEGHG